MSRHGMSKAKIAVIAVLAALFIVLAAFILTDRNDVGHRFPSEDDVPDPVIIDPTDPVPYVEPVDPDDYTEVAAGETATVLSRYTDANGDTAFVPAGFMVSSESDEQTVDTGLVVIGPGGSEYVWIPTSETKLAARDFGVFFSNSDSISRYHDETGLQEYRDMATGVKKYGGFYIGRYEASKGSDGLPASKAVTSDSPGKIWVNYSPQDTTVLCDKLYADNETVQGFFPWAANWDTVLQWLIDSGCKTKLDISYDSTEWGNYSNDTFSEGASGRYTGQWEEAKANNIYDLAGNNWEWTQERVNGNYVMRGGGCSLMGGSCTGYSYPMSLRDPLPGNDHHPNVTFRIALYLV